jgi:orotate phosphoribosyltransferase
MNAETIAEISLNIGSIKLRPNNPFKWASGYRMPIYNDNRMLLGEYENRMLVSNLLKNIIEKNNVTFEYIVGIPTAGIAPAASLADLMNKPLIIYNNGKFLKMDTNFSKMIQTQEYVDVIASTSPYSIYSGVSVANSEKKPFIYVRQKKKEHGMERKIEGILKQGQKVLLIDTFFDNENNYADSAVNAIYDVTNEQINITKGLVIEKEVNVSGKKLLALEDLISTGGSSIKEVIKYREQGAIVENILSIFNYGFPDVIKNFEDKNLTVNSALYYDTMLKVAKEKEYITSEQQEILSDWRIDPWNWGEKNGFSKGSIPLK